MNFHSFIKQIRYFYTKNPKQLANNLNKLGTKFKMTQKVQDKLNTQRFLETQIKDGKFIESIDRTQKYDTQFSEFLKQYRTQHKDIANIIDMTQYSRQQNPFNKTGDQRKEEIQMLEEFRNRQDLRKQQIKRGNKMSEQMGYKEEKSSSGEEEKSSESEEEEKERTVKREVEDLYKMDEFTLLILDQGTTTLITKLNRINHFRALVFMGNAQGIIGYGYGKANDMQIAMDNAVTHCKQNLICIPLDHQLTWMQGINVQHHGFLMRLWCRPKMGFNSWGNPLMVYMLNLAGIRDVSFKIISKTIDPYSMTYAFFDAMTQNQTPREWSEKIGSKIYQQNFGKAYYIDTNNPNKYKHFS